MTKYYLHNGQQQEGPFDIESLRVKNITKDTYIWYEGLQEWTTAGKVPELASIFEKPKPPPFNIAPATPVTPTYSHIPVQPMRKSSNKGLWIAFLIIGIIALSIGVFVAYEASKGPVGDDRARIRQNILNYVTASNSDYQYREAGGIFGLYITVKNRTGYPLDKVRVQVKYNKKFGGVWKTEFLDFANFQAFSEETLKAPDSQRGTNVSYEVILVKSDALGL